MELIAVDVHSDVWLRNSQSVSQLPEKVLVGCRDSPDLLVHGVTQCRSAHLAKTIKVFDPHTLIASRTAQDRAKSRTSRCIGISDEQRGKCRSDTLSQEANI
ncbi:hypothetical protein [Streptomyces litmocidini]|uniref:Uncharacterized protein n=1 Tax=Streptomyces litmocidini TaxID=67318 RepID=A0ABW7U4X4_9ACTN